MPTIEAIRRIRIEQVSTGGEAVRRDLQATADAQQQIGTAAEAAATVTETAARRQLSAGSSFQRLRDQFDQTSRSATAYQRAMSVLDRASAQGVASAADLARTVALVESRYGAAAVQARAFEEATRRAAAAQKAAWQEAGTQGARQLQNVQASRQLGSLGASGPSSIAANENRRLRADQVQNLAYQAGDIFSSLGSGSNLSTVAFQQGPQIAQVFGGLGGASLKGAFAQAGEAATGLASRVGVVGGALGIVTTATVAAVAAQQSYSSTQTALAQQLSGIGRAAGVTASQINALAPAAAAAGGVSVRSAREMAGEFAATGKIGAEMYGGLIGSVKDYAATTGQDVPSATKALAEAFADPAKGADALDKQLAVLNDTTRENIQRLAAQGDRLGAQKALLDAYRTGLTSATELTSAWGRTTAAVGTTISDIWDKVGGAVDRVVTGGDLETQLATAQKVLEASGARVGGLFGTLMPGVAGSDVSTARDEVNRLQAEIQKRDQRLQQAQQNRLSAEIGDAVRGANPLAEQLKKLEDGATKIRSGLSRLPLDEQGDARKTMEGLAASAKLLREDLMAGGTQFAEAIRSAQFGLRTVGFTQQGRSAAEINRRAESETRAANLNASDPLYRDYQVNAIKERQRLELATLRQQSTISESATGGAFSRLTATLQQQVQAASETFGRAPASIIAAIIDKESSGGRNAGFAQSLGENGKPSSAYGVGQITFGAEQDIQRNRIPGFNRMDPSQQVAGVGAYLDLLVQRRNGDLAAAVGDYFGSQDPTKRAGYTADVFRRAGQMGDASTLGQVRDQDANARALQTANDNLRINTELYGRNGLALDAQITANRMLADQLARGVPLTDALRASIDSFATGSATAAQKLKLVQFGADTAFEREQLGRTSGEQSAYTRARSMIGDTSSPEAQFVIAQQQATDNLRQIRDAGQGAFSGILTDLSHGTSAANAFSSALSRIGDKLISFGTDALFSKAFGSLLGGGGGSSDGIGLGGILSSVFGGGFNPFNGFADGGMIHGPGGPREDRVLARLSPGEYVVNAAATSRHFDLIHAINTGRLPGYAQGGLFTSPTPEVGEEGAYDVRIAA